MGESHPSPATAPDCQPLTEQPGKDLQTHGGWRTPYSLPMRGLSKSLTKVVFSCLVLTGCQAAEPPYTTSKACGDRFIGLERADARVLRRAQQSNTDQQMSLRNR